MNHSSITPENTSWDGHLFARTLPIGFDPNYDHGKPVQRRISFPVANLSSPSSFRLTRSRPFRAPDTDQSSANMTSELSVYFYDGTNESKMVQLFRNTDEPLANTLKRIQISLTKKIGSKGKKTKGAICGGLVDDSPSVFKSGTASDVELNVSDFSCGTFLREAFQETLFMKVPVSGFDEPLRILIESNPPTITSVKSFDNLQANIFTNVPIHVQVTCLFASGAGIDWYANDELMQTDSPLYLPKESDIGKEITVLIRPYRTEEHDGDGCQEAYRFTKRVEPFPRNTFLDLRLDWIKPRLSTDTNLRVLTYNILADQNCTPSWHPYCPEEILLKQRRFPLIVHEIVSYNADIICLQEVDEHIFKRLLQPILNEYGYKGYYSSKKTDGQMEGCGLFVNSKRLEWIDCETHELKSSLPFNGPDSWKSSYSIYKLLKKRPDLEEILLSKMGHILQLVYLRDKTSGAQILVGNTHLFFHPNASHIRTLQMWSILRLLAQATEQVCSTSPHVILCGDFNSSLENSCGKLLVEGAVPANFRDLKNHLNAFQWGERGRRFETATSDDDFPEISVQEDFQEMHSAIIPAPSFTHLIPGFKANLDHIVVSNGLVSLKHADIPDEERTTFMPNENIPSDHVSVLCDLKIR